ncbi:hypothetical protein ACFSKW_54315 [Nonomuraea mangrovi]|uniref:Exo-alpha-sialidase n=1 Tax=Nonomuraea mangrovi TaxID=2316207 RepID=A0ABW4THP9_9ACTN
MKIANRAMAAVSCLSLLAACSGLTACSGGGGGAGAGGSTAPAARPDGGATRHQAGPTASPTPSAVPVSRRWRDVGRLPLADSSGLMDVVATGPRQAWALGFENGAEDDGGYATVARWNGAKWSKLPIPRYLGYDGFDATGPNDLWIAGGDTVARWDGRRWTEKRPFGISEDKHFHDVASDGDRAVLIGSDGPRSFIVTSGRGGYELVTGDGESMLNAVTSRAGHTWIVGAKPRANCDGVTPDIVHSRKADGSGWDHLRVPDIRGGTLTSVVQISPTDVWAVGKIVNSRQVDPLPDRSCPAAVYDAPEGAESRATPLALHWDGRSWKREELPLLTAEPTGVTAFGPDDVWVAAADPDRPADPLFLHFDGRTWTAERGAGGRIEAVAAIPGTKDLWAVGWPGDYEDHGSAVVLRRDGRARPGRARS